MSEQSKKKQRDRIWVLTHGLNRRLDGLIKHLDQASWESKNAWCYVPPSCAQASTEILNKWMIDRTRVEPCGPERLRYQVLHQAILSMDHLGIGPVTVEQAIFRIERDRETLVHNTAARALEFIDELIAPSNRLPVIERPTLAARWPWPLDSAAGALAHLLTAVCPTTPVEEWLFSMWPSGVSVARVAEWARPLLDTVQTIPSASEWRFADVLQGAPILQVVGPQYRRGLLIPSSALANLYLLEQEVITAKRTPRMRIDAGQVQQGVIAGHSHLHQTLERNYIFPKEGTAYSSTHQTLEVLLPAQHQFGIPDSQSSAQLTLPGIPELESMPERIADSLRKFYRYTGLRHWTALLVLLSRYGHTGWIRWTLRAALDAMRLADNPKNRALTIEMIELFTKLELTVWDEQKQRRRRTPFVYWKDRDEMLHNERWEIVGIDLCINPAVYGGCGGEDGSGNNYALAPIELATLETNRWGPAVPLGLQLPARWLYESRRRGSNSVVISGRELLRMAGMKYERSSRTWKRLERNLDKLGEIDALDSWSWDVGPALDTRCEIRAPDWMADRTLRRVKTKPVKRSKQILNINYLTGSDLMSWRMKNGFTQQQAANRLGVSRRRYGDQERQGDKPVSAQIRRSFANFLNKRRT